MRTETSIVAETAQCFSTHHVALLVGYGAHAICPYLAFETCRQWRSSSRSVCLSLLSSWPLSCSFYKQPSRVCQHAYWSLTCCIVSALPG